MIYFAPLQSYTTFAYYLAFNSQIGGINKYFTPFYRKNKKGIFEYEKYLKANNNINIVPQILTNKGEDLIEFAQDMINSGFQEINLNIGCPFPLVTHRHLGSGLLPFSEEIKNMMNTFHSAQLPISLSIKCRLGWEDTMEILSALQVFEQFPVSEIILHPRLGIQKYKGSPDWDSFEKIIDIWNGDIVGNGDITTYEELIKKRERFNKVKGWMIGRGILANPLLLRNDSVDNDIFNQTLIHLREAFYNNLKEFGYSDEQTLNHLKCFWEYPSKNFEGGDRIYRKLRKIGKLQDFWDAEKKFFQQKIILLN